MKKNNILFIAIIFIFILTCIVTFMVMSGGNSKPNTQPAYISSGLQTTEETSNFFLTDTTTTPSTVFSTLPADNHIQTQSQPAETHAPTTSEIYAAATAAQPQPSSEDITAAKDADVVGKMCIITAGAADTWDGSNNEDTYVPYLSTLVKGTMDYIVGTSEKYDTEEGKMRYFYNLSCGRRIIQSCAQVVDAAELGNNSISVVSSTVNDSGELTVVLSEKWKVPYYFSYAPQNYYTSNGKNFYVNEFTAQAISLTFYHTNEFSGDVNTSGSAIVSSANWTSDPSQNTVTLTMPLISQGKFYGYSAVYDQNNNLVITINNKPKSLSGSVIMLDPGHGGKDSGALSPSNGYESEVNRAVSLLVKDELEKRGATVYLTRSANEYLSLEERKEKAYAVKPDVFVSLHCDGSETSDMMGTSAYYFKPMSKALAQSIHDEIVPVYRNDIYLGQAEKIKDVDRGCRFYPFSVTRIEDCPAVLIEMGFVTNAEEYKTITDSANQQKIAAAIANGIEKYISSN